MPNWAFDPSYIFSAFKKINIEKKVKIKLNFCRRKYSSVKEKYKILISNLGSMSIVNSIKVMNSTIFLFADKLFLSSINPITKNKKDIIKKPIYCNVN